MFRHLAGVGALLYGLISIVGGVYGWWMAGSVASLVAGGICGVILLLCGVGIFKGAKTSFLSLLGAVLVSLALVGFFLYDTIKHAENLGAFFEQTLGQTALVMLGGGAVVLILALTALYRRAK